MEDATHDSEVLLICLVVLHARRSGFLMRNYVNMLLLILPLVFGTNAFPAELEQLQQERSSRISQIERIKANMFSYILDHKAATASILATGGGISAFLTESMDSDTRSMVMLIGIFGLAYCVDSEENAKECATVTAQLGSYAAKIETQQQAIGSIDKRLAALYRPTQIAPRTILPNSPPPVVPPVAPHALVGSDSAGPFFSQDFPDGVYVSNGAEIKLVLTVEPNVSTTLAKFDLANFKQKAESAESKLHKSNELFRYVLLEKDSLLVLKHSTDYQDYSEIKSSSPGYGLNVIKASNGWIQAKDVVRNSPAQASGVERGDYIISVDGVSTIEMSMEDFIERVKGDVGAQARIVFMRSNDMTKSYVATLTKAIVSYPAQKNVMGYVGIYRDGKGKFFYFRNDRDEYFGLPLGEKKELLWSLGGAEIKIAFARPDANADKHDREVDYFFSVR